MDTDNPQTTLVLGGGPAGLTAGYLLGKAGRDVIVLEADDQVGGLAKTVEIDGYRFDLGGHRFFTKSTEVDLLWHEILGDEFLRRPRMSRIFWNNRYLDYPLRGSDVIRKLGPVELTRCMASYLRAAARRNKVDESLEDWVTNRFGRRLFELFFKSYNEKVWGVPTSEIRAEWAAQRIRGLSFFSAAKAAFFGNEGNKVKSLISEFNYPRFGPGQMWDAMTSAIEAEGGEVLLRSPVSRIELAGGRVVEVAAGDELYAGFATATSSASHSWSTARICSPTTGSTSMSRPCGSGASRTSARGRRGWSRILPRPASVSSTSASPVTISGR
jgi:protoporphyrinogen oxidase